MTTLKNKIQNLKGRKKVQRFNCEMGTIQGRRNDQVKTNSGMNTLKKGEEIIPTHLNPQMWTQCE